MISLVFARSCLRALVGFGLCSSLPALAGDGDATKLRKPNIVLLFADDAGYRDFGFQGSRTMRTPHLDRLAREGTRFSQAYVTDPTCGPSRAGLLTGRYQQRFGFEENNVPGYMSANSKLDGAEMGLPLAERTIADHLRARGYRTGLLGKWHQGDADHYHPLRRGFDEFYGFRGGSRSYWPYTDPLQPSPQNKMERGFGNYREHEGYLTDALAMEAVSFIRRNRERPFFLFVSFNAVHTPMEALPEDLAAFRTLLGVRRLAAAQMLALDRASGAILAELMANGLEGETLVVFANDNGGEVPHNGSVNYPLAGTKATFLEGGLRIPMLMRWPGRVATGRVYHQPVSLLDLLPTFLDAAGGDPSAIPGLDGTSLLPYLTGNKAGRPHRTLFWKRGARAAIRDHDWKLLRHSDRPAELFDLRRDVGEQRDLASRRPDILRMLFRKLFAWETKLERPLWMLRGEYDRSDIEWMDHYRTPSETWRGLDSMHNRCSRGLTRSLVCQ
ncbi:sulfatase-like hydrolase/transferase (plasmid) [Sphingomonas panni]|uniref:sulfatase-like hydrolase/transferase n=1 Tax=Sphingomonas hankookensis TaxID=563996 RepID=UPI003D3023C9